jgi:hypothetical protein
MPTTYRELQATMRALRDQGKTTIRLNSSYADLMQEFKRIEVVDEVSVCETGDEPGFFEALTQIGTALCVPPAPTKPTPTVYRVKYDRPHLIPVRRLGRVMDALLSRHNRFCIA